MWQDFWQSQVCAMASAINRVLSSGVWRFLLRFFQQRDIVPCLRKPRRAAFFDLHLRLAFIRGNVKARDK